MKILILCRLRTIVHSLKSVFLKLRKQTTFFFFTWNQIHLPDNSFSLSYARGFHWPAPWYFKSFKWLLGSLGRFQVLSKHRGTTCTMLTSVHQFAPNSHRFLRRLTTIPCYTDEKRVRSDESFQFKLLSVIAGLGRRALFLQFRLYVIIYCFVYKQRIAIRRATQIAAIPFFNIK